MATSGGPDWRSAEKMAPILMARSGVAIDEGLEAAVERADERQ